MPEVLAFENGKYEQYLAPFTEFSILFHEIFLLSKMNLEELLHI